MLDGRVLEASQVEYKPFGKPPLQRELPFFFYGPSFFFARRGQVGGAFKRVMPSERFHSGRGGACRV